MWGPPDVGRLRGTPVTWLEEQVRWAIKQAVPHDLRDVFDQDDGDIWLDMAVAAIRAMPREARVVPVEDPMEAFNRNGGW